MRSYAHTWTSQTSTGLKLKLFVRKDLFRRIVEGGFVNLTHDGRPAVEHGYALTAYAAQGLTCRHALVLARDEAYSEWIYTTMTRAQRREPPLRRRRTATTETSSAPAEPARDGRVLLAAALTRSRADELAIERLLPGRAARSARLDPRALDRARRRHARDNKASARSEPRLSSSRA